MQIISSTATETVIEAKADASMRNAIMRTVYYVPQKALKVEFTSQNRGNFYILQNVIEYLPVKNSIHPDVTMRLSAKNDKDIPLVVTTRSFSFKHASHDDVFPQEYYICMLFRDQYVNANISIVEGTCSGDSSKFKAITKMQFEQKDDPPWFHMRLVNNGVREPLDVFLSAIEIIKAQLTTLNDVIMQKKETTNIEVMLTDDPYAIMLRMKVDDKHTIPCLIMSRFIDETDGPFLRPERFCKEPDLPDVCWIFYMVKGSDRRKELSRVIEGIHDELSALTVKSNPASSESTKRDRRGRNQK